MLVHFSASSRNIHEDVHLYRRISKKIYSMEHVIVNDWVEAALNRATGHGNTMGFGMNIGDIVRNATAAVEKADVLICEASGQSAFGVGYEFMLALNAKKPVLCLINERLANHSYASAFSNDANLTVKVYDENTVEKIVENFLRDNTVKTRDLRFNFVIDRRIYNHLRAKSFESGKTKAEIVRDLLAEDIERAH